jgi:diguanylate cyclase (GGDEF)-like protein
MSLLIGLGLLNVAFIVTLVAGIRSRRALAAAQDERETLERDRKRFQTLLRGAFHDPLTQLANRALFHDRVTHALAVAERADRLVAVMFVDLDDFKVINDQQGHAAGDEVLVAVANRLRSCLRSADTAARLGGDEFGVLLESIGTPAEAAEIAERIVAAFEEPLVLHGQDRSLTVSIGIAIGAGPEDEPDNLLRDADLAMYSVKLSGKRGYEFYDDGVEATVLERLDPEGVGPVTDSVARFLRIDEQRAQVLALIELGGIKMVFQPILDLRSGLVVGYEALSRFADADRRPPNAVFSQAHRCGLGMRLEAEALRVAFGHTDRPKGMFLSLNLSPSALASEPVQRVLPRSLSNITIEVTENELVRADGNVAEAIADARARGARIAIDDAGSGYAGLKQIMRLQPDLIKLDRGLVDGVRDDPAKAALIEAVVRYGHKIGAEVCAEGVEELDDLAALAALDVAYAQGYCIAHPLEPWTGADPAASAICTASLSAQLRGDIAPDQTVEGGDARLERISAWLSTVGSPQELDRLMEPISMELGADHVCLSRIHGDGAFVETIASHCMSSVGARYELSQYPATAAVLEDHSCVQVLMGDPAADPAEIDLLTNEGVSSLLMLPVLSRSQSVGLLELTRRDAKPWSRVEIQRARVIAYQLGGVIERLELSLGAGSIERWVQSAAA